MRILVIEDEPRILSFLVRGLEAEGFGVDSACDGVEALRQIRRSRHDLVVLDLLLPRIDGLTVLRELQGIHSETPVVILSARGDLATKLRGFELGASDFVPKPFSLDELIARIHVQLRHAAAPPGSDHALRVGSLVLDLARRQAQLGTLVADLSDREFKLLHELVLHAGEVISRERLLADVWGYDFDPGSNVVEVCVRRLRKKLGARAPIETVRNAGYRLSAA